MPIEANEPTDRFAQGSGGPSELSGVSWHQDDAPNPGAALERALADSGGAVAAGATRRPDRLAGPQTNRDEQRQVLPQWNRLAWTRLMSAPAPMEDTPAPSPAHERPTRVAPTDITVFTGGDEGNETDVAVTSLMAFATKPESAGNLQVFDFKGGTGRQVEARYRELEGWANQEGIGFRIVDAVPDQLFGDATHEQIAINFARATNAARVRRGEPVVDSGVSQNLLLAAMNLLEQNKQPVTQPNLIEAMRLFRESGFNTSALDATVRASFFRAFPSSEAQRIADASSAVETHLSNSEALSGFAYDQRHQTGRYERRPSRDYDRWVTVYALPANGSFDYTSGGLDTFAAWAAIAKGDENPQHAGTFAVYQNLELLTPDQARAVRQANATSNTGAVYTIGGFLGSNPDIVNALGTTNIGVMRQPNEPTAGLVSDALRTLDNWGVTGKSRGRTTGQSAETGFAHAEEQGGSRSYKGFGWLSLLVPENTSHSHGHSDTISGGASVSSSVEHSTQYGFRQQPRAPSEDLLHLPTGIVLLRTESFDVDPRRVDPILRQPGVAHDMQLLAHITEAHGQGDVRQAVADASQRGRGARRLRGRRPAPREIERRRVLPGFEGLGASPQAEQQPESRRPDDDRRGRRRRP